MSLPYCTMTSRPARLILSEQEKSNALGKVARFISRINVKSHPVGLAYNDVRLVIDANERVIKIMTEHEYQRLYPTLAVVDLLPGKNSMAA